MENPENQPDANKPEQTEDVPKKPEIVQEMERLTGVMLEREAKQQESDARIKVGILLNQIEEKNIRKTITTLLGITTRYLYLKDQIKDKIKELIKSKRAELEKEHKQSEKGKNILSKIKALEKINKYFKKEDKR